MGKLVCAAQSSRMGHYYKSSSVVHYLSGRLFRVGLREKTMILKRFRVSKIFLTCF
jgi:hypothetical protein